MFRLEQGLVNSPSLAPTCCNSSSAFVSSDLGRSLYNPGLDGLRDQQSSRQSVGAGLLRALLGLGLSSGRASEATAKCAVPLRALSAWLSDQGGSCRFARGVRASRRFSRDPSQPSGCSQGLPRHVPRSRPGAPCGLPARLPGAQRCSRVTFQTLHVGRTRIARLGIARIAPLPAEPR